MPPLIGVAMPCTVAMLGGEHELEQRRVAGREADEGDHRGPQTSGEVAVGRLIALLGHSDAGGAQPTLMAATADLPGDTFVGPSGRLGTRGEPGVVERSARAEDTQMARSLWSLSEELTEVSFPLSLPARSCAAPRTA